MAVIASALGLIGAPAALAVTVTTAPQNTAPQTTTPASAGLRSGAHSLGFTLSPTGTQDPIGDVEPPLLDSDTPRATVEFEIPPAPLVLPTFTGAEFNRMFSEANLPNVADITQTPPITRSPLVDELIREHAEQRGYSRRSLPANYSEMQLIDDGLALQQPAAVAWLALRADAAANGLDIVLSSAYRGHDYQRTVFLRPLAEPYEFEDFADRMLMSAPPGYSKHHTGYAIDIAQDGYRYFGGTPAHAWLSRNNFQNAKRHGWIPSYPPDGGRQGPVPEPWELTYVGIETILCFHQPPSDYDPLCSQIRVGPAS